MIYQNREDLIRLTSLWQGERFDDGRPRVGDDLLRRVGNMLIEDVCSPLRKRGFKCQFQGELCRTRPKTRLLGRAITMAMVASRPDVHMELLNYGHRELGKRGYFNQWVVDAMRERDVLVADVGGKVFEGTFLGGNLATVIHSRTKTGGAVIWGGIHDVEQISQMKGIQVYYRGSHPAPVQDMMVSGVNVPCDIGGAICMPGDVVLGAVGGVVFIPAHLVESVAIAGEKQQVIDWFCFERLAQGAYTSSQLDLADWPPEIMEDFLLWFHTSPQSQPFQHLSWAEEQEKTRAAERYEWTGLSSMPYIRVDADVK